MPETLSPHQTLSSEQATARLQKINQGDATKSSLGVLYSNDTLNQAQDVFGVIELSKLKLGKREREEKFHSIASRVYSVVEKMNRDPQYRLSEKEREDIHTIADSVDVLKDEENLVFQEVSSQIDANTTDENRQDSERKKEVAKKLRDTNIAKHKALERYTDKIFEEDVKRGRGEGKGKAPDVQDAKKSEALNPQEYRDVTLVSENASYADLRNRVVDSFGPNTTLRKDYIAGVSDASKDPDSRAAQIETDLNSIESLRAELIAQRVNMFATDERLRQIDEVILPALTQVEGLIKELQLKVLDEVNKNNSNVKEDKDKKVVDRFLRKDKFLNYRQKLADIRTRIADGFTNLDEVEVLRQETQAAIVGLDIDTEVALLKAENVHPDKVQKFKDDLRSLKEHGEKVVEVLSAKAFDVWTSQVEARADYRDLIAYISSSAVTGTLTVDACLDRARDISERLRTVGADKATLLSTLNSFPNAKTKAEQAFAKLEDDAKNAKDKLEKDAYAKWIVEVETTDPEVKELIDAINSSRTVGTTIPAITAQETRINNAINILDPMVAAKAGAHHLLRTAAEKHLLDRIKEGKDRIKDVLSPAKDKLRTSSISSLSDDILKRTFDEAACNALCTGLGITLGFESLLRKLEDDFAEWKPNMSDAGVAGIIEKYKSAKEKLTKIVTEHEQSSQSYREKIWTAIMNKTVTGPNEMSDAQTNILKSCDLLPPGNRQGQREAEIKYWEEVFKVTKAFINGASGDPGARRRMAWFRAGESRSRIEGLAGDGITTAFFREYYHGKDASSPTETEKKQHEMVDKIRELYKDGYAYTDRTGNSKVWSFAQKGEPDEEQVKDGAKPLDKVLREKFPNADLYPDSLINTAIYYSIVIELRMPYLANWYRNYLVSPDFDVSPITDVDPEAGAYYDIRKLGSVDPSKLFWLKVIAAPAGPSAENPELIDPKIYKVDHHTHVRTVVGHSFDYEDLGSRRAAVGNEYQPAPAAPNPKKPGEYLKDDINTAVQNEAIEDAYELAVMTDISLTAVYRNAFKPVRRTSGRRNLIPYYSEGILADSSFGIEYDKNPENLKHWQDFLKIAQNPPRLGAHYGARSALVDVASALSKAKEIFSYLENTKDPARLNDFTNVIVEILKRYTKNIFNQFYEITQGNSPQTMITNAWVGKEILNNDQFVHEAIDTFDGLKTLPGRLSLDLISEIRRLSKDGDNGIIIGKSGFFSGSVNDPTYVVGVGFFGDRPERNRRREKMELFKQKREERVATSDPHK